ncbi:uncharacterized protein FA14DRAFT_181600 [Meira miltonrushii]|uniref:Uncharacterized protein n=1 Tax=Meira miltonrushii TaxID=1280837 RepID=A0A316V5R3_9BASI|nr:uncharacterized protein FA14DRAFT_181600 [Meira miltonrushii]PWN32929.1 hypothetical protein FA14DRAFT_181600 [Meira miltonrushii]
MAEHDTGRVEFRAQDSSAHPTAPFQLYQNSVVPARESPEWYAKQKPSMTYSAVVQRMDLAKLKSENYDAYISKRKKHNESNKARRQALEGEAKKRAKALSSQSSKRFSERRKQMLNLPENALKAKLFRQKGAEACKKSRDKIMEAIKSGKATPKQIETYNKQKRAKALYSRKRYAQEKAEREALKVSNKG